MSGESEPTKLILRCFLSPGDIVMLTAAVRDLHRNHPGRFVTDVRTSAGQLWENNPYVARLDEADPAARTIDIHYPLIDKSNQRPYHFIHGYPQYLEQQLGVPVPVTEFKGDIHLSPAEKGWISQVEESGFRGRFWVVVAGGKYDFTAKWWSPAEYQAVVNHFLGKILFVQCGESHHWHPKLENVLSLVGRTDIRQFVRLVHHADGVLSPVTFAMHLAAAVESRPGRPKNRACVVIAGGREPPHWEAYPHHQFLCTNGALPCCEDGGCWKARCQRVGDNDQKDRQLCRQPVQVSASLRIPKCMKMITSEDVIRRIEMYYEGGALEYNG
jgi:ADP-heptose:LPS heptosyltransferase